MLNQVKRKNKRNLHRQFYIKKIYIKWPRLVRFIFAFSLVWFIRPKSFLNSCAFRIWRSSEFGHSEFGRSLYCLSGFRHKKVSDIWIKLHGFRTVHNCPKSELLRNWTVFECLKSILVPISVTHFSCMSFHKNLQNILPFTSFNF